METVTQDQDTNPEIEAGGSFMILPTCLRLAIVAGQLTHATAWTYGAIVSFTTGNGQTAHPHRRTIAAAAGIEYSTVPKHLAELKRLGFIGVERQPFGGASKYTVYDPCGKCIKGWSQNHKGVAVQPPPGSSTTTYKGTRSSYPDPLPRTRADRSFKRSIEEEHREQGDLEGFGDLLTDLLPEPF